MRHLSSKLKKAKRVTISLEEELDEKISQLQIHLREIASEEWSMSKTINMLLLCGILSQDKLSMIDVGTIKEFTDGTKIRLDDISMESYVTSLISINHSYKF